MLSHARVATTTWHGLRLAARNADEISQRVACVATHWQGEPLIRSGFQISVALLLLVGAGFAMAAIGQTPAQELGASASKVLLLADQGTIRFRDSKAGKAIVRAKAMAPGTSRTGHARVGITGGDARVQLKRSSLKSPRGPAGGKLAPALKIKLSKLKGRKAKTLYSGRLTKLKRVNLGRWSSGKLQRFRVKVRFPNQAASQDTLQGARVKFGLVWRVSA